MIRPSGMSAMTTLRPSGMSSELARKFDRIMLASERRQLIEQVRTALANIVDIGERDWAARKRSSCAGGAEPSRLLIEALCASADFEMIVKELK